MTTHSFTRFIAGMSLLLSGALFLATAPAAAQTAAATGSELTFDQRLERLAAEIERNRVNLHVPGAALAVVRGDEVVFARGFGLADVENQTPVTPETPFFIGSSTKAFTATLVGMLVDDGLMSWDDPIEQHLPYFTLAVESADPGARATIRDVLSHRTGFPRMPFLWANGALSSEEILRQASFAEPFAPFRERFYYNNVQYLAAGWAAAAAAGQSWDVLIAERILTPLGMADTRTSMEEAWRDPLIARGYSWDEAGDELRLLAPGTAGLNVDPVAPAGAISSTVLDMASWLRFLLSDGVVDGQTLIRPESLAATWTPQIAIEGDVAYGMGWFVRDSQGQRLIEHGGQLPGFSAEVGLLPDSDLGFVVLANTLSTLPSLAINLVPQYLLGDLPEARAGDAEYLEPYLGRYIANFAAFSNEVFTILERDGGLALDIPSQMEFVLNPPDEEGQWQFALTDEIEVSFERDEAGNVVALIIHQGGGEFEAPREGVALEPEIDLAEIEPYVGDYREDDGVEMITVLVQNQRLAVRFPSGNVLDFNAPDDDGRWVSRAKPDLAVAFEESETGAVVGANIYRPGEEPVLRLTRSESSGPALPTVAELMELRGTTGPAPVETMRTAGRVVFPQSAVEGRFESTTAGDDRLRVDIDLDRFGQIQVALDADRAWRASSVEPEPFMEITGDMLEQIRLGHASVLFGDWRLYFDSVRVVRAGDLDGRPIYLVRLESAGLPPMMLSVDAETGDVLEDRRTMVIPGLGGLPVTTTYADYRDVGGMRIPFRSVESNEQTGRTIYEIESVEVNVDVDPERFILRPPPEDH